MAKPDADPFIRRHLHDFLYFRQHLAVFAAQTNALLFRMTGAAPEAVGGKSRKPDHFEIRILQSDPDVLGSHAKTHSDTAIHLDLLVSSPRAIMSSMYR